MKKLIVLATVTILISGCGRKYSRDSSGSGDLDPSKLTTVMIKNFNSSTSSFTELTLDLMCSKALPGDKDWVENAVKVNSGSPSFNLVKGVACTITLKNYTDLTQSFTPKADSLILNISEAGIGTLTDPAVEYSRDPADDNKWYFAANTTAAYNVVLNFGNDPKKTLADMINKEMNSVAVTTGQGAAAPSVSELFLTKTINNSNQTDYSLFGIATNFTACKLFNLIDIQAFDYNSINTAFGAKGIICPDSLLKGTQGNWNDVVANGSIIVWANVEAGTQFNGYTYVQISANP